MSHGIAHPLHIPLTGLSTKWSKPPLPHCTEYCDKWDRERRYCAPSKNSMQIHHTVRITAEEVGHKSHNSPSSQNISVLCAVQRENHPVSFIYYIRIRKARSDTAHFPKSIIQFVT